MEYNETDNGAENNSIQCSVSQCKYHLKSDYCSLDRIKVVVNDNVTNVTSVNGTDCGSFETK